MKNKRNRLAHYNDFVTSSGRICDISIYHSGKPEDPNVAIEALWHCPKEQSTKKDFEEIEAAVNHFFKQLNPEVEIENLGHMDARTTEEAEMIINIHIAGGKPQ